MIPSPESEGTEHDKDKGTGTRARSVNSTCLELYMEATGSLSGMRRDFSHISVTASQTGTYIFREACRGYELHRALDYEAVVVIC